MTVMQLGYDMTKRNLWPGEFSPTLPVADWSAPGMDIGAPVYVSSGYVVTVTGVAEDLPNNDGTYIVCYGEFTGTQVWKFKLPFGDPGPSGSRGRSWLMGVTNTHAICLRPNFEYDNLHQRVYGLLLTNGSVDYELAMPDDPFGADEAFHDNQRMCILPNGNILTAGWKDSALSPYAQWFAEFDGTDGTWIWTRQYEPSTGLVGLYNNLLYKDIVSPDNKISYSFNNRNLNADEASINRITANYVAYDLVNKYTIGSVVYGPNQEGYPLICAMGCADRGPFGARIFGDYQMGYAPTLRKTFRTLVCYDANAPVPVEKWRVSLTVRTPAFPKLWLFPATRPSIDIFGRVYVLDNDGLLRQIDGNGNEMHVFELIGPPNIYATAHGCMHDTAGKMLQIERGFNGGIRMFDLASADPYRIIWELPTSNAWWTAPCLWANSIYINANGVLTKYSQYLPDTRPDRHGHDNETPV